MAALFTRIRDKVHRRSDSSAFAGQSHDDRPGAVKEEPVSASPRSVTCQAPSRVSLGNSAFHVSQEGQHRRSFEDPKFTSCRDNQNERIMTVDSGRSKFEELQTLAEDLVPGRWSSKDGDLSTSRTIRRKTLNSQRAVGDLIPPRKSSKHVFRGTQGSEQMTEVVQQADLDTAGLASQDKSSAHDVPMSPKSQLRSTEIVGPDGSQEHVHNNSTYISQIHESDETNHDPDNGMLDNSQITAHKLNDLQPLEPTTGTQNVDHNKKGSVSGHTVEQATFALGHLRLPEGLRLENTEQTHVIEERRPAVTNETIIKERTEIIREAVTMDTHIHHYYTYLQPVKVVEVLPAKHYVLDPETGEKVEIPAPAGWKMPKSMTPISPDISMIKGWTRHYLVDEEFPQGVPELPPLKHESDVDKFRHEASAG